LFQREKKKVFCCSFEGVLWRKFQRKKSKEQTPKKEDFFYLSFSFSSFSSSSITIVSLISQRPTAQKDFLLYIRKSIISSSSSIPSFIFYIFLLLQIEHASGQVSLDRPRVNAVSSRVRLRVHGRLRDVHL
jgi:hypothetical protein